MNLLISKIQLIYYSKTLSKNRPRNSSPSKIKLNHHWKHIIQKTGKIVNGLLQIEKLQLN